MLAVLAAACWRFGNLDVLYRVERQNQMAIGCLLERLRLHPMFLAGDSHATQVQGGTHSL